MDLFDLTGKVAIVTGGNGGIGLGMATGLAKAGARVVVAARNAEKSAAAVQSLAALGPEPLAVTVDVADSASIETMVSEVAERCGRIDILVNNAGTNIRKRPEDLAESEWQQVIDTNLSSAFLCSKACFPHLKADGGGKVMNNGSMYSIFGSPVVPAYAATKGGLVQLTKSLAAAWAADNIQVNCFLPGWIDTDLTRAAREQVEGLHGRVLDRTPSGRWGEPADFEGIAVFLASRASDFVTGTVVPVDGGYSIAAG